MSPQYSDSKNKTSKKRLLTFNRRLGRTCHLNIQIRRIKQVITSADFQQAFRRNMSPQSSDPKNGASKESSVKRLEGRTISLPIYDGNMFHETSVDFQRTTRRYIPEGRTLHNQRCGNLQFCIMHVSGSSSE
jgi:hypothetical protein